MVGILLGLLVTAPASRSRQPPPARVLRAGDRLEVIWPAAEAIPAEVIELHAGGNLSEVELIRYAMREVDRALHVHDPVPPGVTRAAEDPTPKFVRDRPQEDPIRKGGLRGEFREFGARVSRKWDGGNHPTVPR